MMATIIKGLCIAVMAAGLVMGGILTGQVAEAADASKQAQRALIKTKYGEIEIKLYPDVAPSTSRISSSWRSPGSITAPSFIASFPDS
jgi:hypothetical protein